MNTQTEKSQAVPAIARANSRLANKNTPLIHNAWYIVGWTHEISRTPIERVLLGTSVVLYRKQDGTPVALRNRCPHRSFPLVHGTLEGDVLRCGYHGLAFNAQGRCIDVPTQTDVPAGLCTPAYALQEQGPFVWIWMGDQSRADASLIPNTDWLCSPKWEYATSYLHVKASYIYLHENLLDLSHFTFLHPTTLGTPEYATTPFTVKTEGNQVQIQRLVQQCDVPPIYAKTGFKGKMSRQTDSEFVSPGMHHASAIMVDLEAPESQPSQCTTYITHFLTPETQDTTHYWFTFARDFALGDPAVTEHMRQSALTAFHEDLHALQEIDRIQQQEQDAIEGELHIRSDQAGIAARRILMALAQKERAGETHA